MVICLVCTFPSWVMVLEFSKKVHFFCNFQLALVRNLTLLKQFTYTHVYASERSCYGLSEDGIAYYAMTYCFEDTRVWSRRILLKFCWVNNFFDILIANILRTVTRTSTNHIIFWKSVMKTFRCIYVNCFNRLRFLAEVRTNSKKEMHFFGQFKDHNSWGAHWI